MGLGDINGFPNNKKRLLMLENLNITKVNLNDKRSARVWGRCQLKRSKTPVQSTGLYISRCQRKLISHRQMTETCVALPHKACVKHLVLCRAVPS